MHPVARTLQVLFMLAGFALLATGWIMADDAHGRTEYRMEWVCEPDAGSKTKQRCASQGMSSNYSFINDDVPETGVTIGLAGVGLIVASASVAIGSRKSAAGPVAGPAVGAGAPAGPYGASPYGGQTPPPPGQGPHQGY
ncbi:hypothetical protein [Streptomyces sp. NPDC050504]|uniref:hypothetical protein n=1 Tax=Streptomyces sp. NPDC050504 TaxID=3365618 RepID=UPI0037A17E37